MEKREPIDHTEVVNCKKHRSDGVCPICFDNVFGPLEEEIAKMSAWDHFVMFCICFFYFQFIDAYLEIVWCISRIFKIGDYAEGGYFDRRGIKWRD